MTACDLTFDVSTACAAGFVADEVVVTVLTLAQFHDECYVQRLRALVGTAGRKVHALLDATVLPTIPRALQVPNLTIAPLPAVPNLTISSLLALGGERGGRGPPGFLMWASEAPASRIWHIEPDAFFMGPWCRMFDEYAASNVDVLGKLSDVTRGDQRGWKRSCKKAPLRNLPGAEQQPNLPGAEQQPSCKRVGTIWTCRKDAPRCFSGPASEPCVSCWTLWPALRLSRRLARATLSAFNAGWTGHQEAIIGPICKHHSWCTNASFVEAHTRFVHMGGEPGFKLPANASNRMTWRGIARFHQVSAIPRHTLVHPVKCEAKGMKASDQCDVASRAPGLPTAQKVLVVIMSGQEPPLPSLRSACRTPALQCVAYLPPQLGGAGPNWTQDAVSWPPDASHIRRVLPGRYLGNGTVNMPRTCCRKAQAQGGSFEGTVGFFCNSHRTRTLLHQYRFLPAIAHASRSVGAVYHRGHEHEWLHDEPLEADSVGWLLVVDDDSHLEPQALLRLLATLDPRENLYLGDTIVPRGWRPVTEMARMSVPALRRRNGTSTSARAAPVELENGMGYTAHTRGWPPMACSGSGVLLSAAAAVTVKWNQCVRDLHGTCAQADWLIGKCAADWGVPVDGKHGCSVCGLDCAAIEALDSQRLEGRLRSGHCSFVQYPGDAEKRCDPAAKQRVCSAIREGGAAASHGCRGTA